MPQSATSNLSNFGKINQMKNTVSRNIFRPKVLIISVVSITCLFTSINTSEAQKPLELSLGIGLPDLMNLGVGFRHRNIKIGANTGGFLRNDSGLSTVGLDFYAYIEQESDTPSKSAWLINLGLSKIKDKKEASVDKYLYIKTRLGRDIFISDQLNLELGLGLIAEVDYKTNREPSQSCFWSCGDESSDRTVNVLPSFSLKFNIKLFKYRSK